jgi:hypothetical protein
MSFGVTSGLSARPSAAASQAVASLDRGEGVSGEALGAFIYADLRDTSAAPILAPKSRMGQAPTANITVSYVPNAAWPAEAITAFEAAVAVWESLIVSNVEIKVEAKWTDMQSDWLLGWCRPHSVRRNFSGAPQADTWYVIALANKLAGVDHEPAAVDIEAEFNSARDWYFGTSGSPPYGTFDFMSVVLHELTHGLGMIGSMQVADGLGSWGLYDYGGNSYSPLVFDRYFINGSGSSIIDISSYPNPSGALAAQLISDDLYFSGANARAANSGSNPKLYAPTSWKQGSSCVHLDEMFNGTANTLMTYSFEAREVIHHPGPIVLGIFKDIGWTNSTTSPTATAIAPTAIVPPTATALAPTATSVPPLTLRHRSWLPHIDRLFVNPQATAQPTAHPTAQPTPTAQTPPATFTIVGQMTHQGYGAGSLFLELRLCPTGAGACSTSASTTTASDGTYAFQGVTPPPSDKFLYVRYANYEERNDRVAYWFGDSIYAASASGTYTLPTYEVMNIAMLAPSNGATVSLPSTFQWTRRVASNDSYWLEVFDPVNDSAYASTVLLGYVGSFTVGSLPSSFLPYTAYGWDVCAAGPGDSYGCSYYYRTITFINTQASIGRAPALNLSRDRHPARLDERVRRVAP